MNWNDSLQKLKGIGEKTAQAFHKLHIDTIGDLLRFYPRDYDLLEEITPVSALEGGKRSVVRAGVAGSISEKRVRSLTITTVYVSDATGRLLLTFFNLPYIRHELRPGTALYFRGTVSFRGKQAVMEQPVILTAKDYENLKGHLQPIYSLTAGIHQSIVRKAVRQVLENADFPETIPSKIREAYKLFSHNMAVSQIHFPDHMAALQEARKRLVFDEFLFFLLQVKELKNSGTDLTSSFPMLEVADTGRLLEALPFKLTDDQNKVWEEMKADLSGKSVMNRLIQGDVGSGKTILALLALLMTAANGYQGAMMVPTEVLALQHFEWIRSLSRQHRLPIIPVLLTGSLSAKEKKEVYQLVESGKVNCIIGTHALIQEAVRFQKLALIITDEQHRFGVRQREMLIQKGNTPHVCVMSATPIPRTLAMILYGDLQISVIHQLPAERLPVKNCVIGVSGRKKAYQFIQKEVEARHQAFVICPMIEREEESDNKLENVLEYAEKLRAELPESCRISILHGKMKQQEKNRIMNAFSGGDIDILVSTTVIEVGVNIPNATVMMVENAERFGLAQLHQLRGRVGRGKDQSYCIFVHAVDPEKTDARLKVLESSNDGFYIAEQDMKLRGPGDLFGIRQSGEMNFVLADIYQDSEILLMADEACRKLTEGQNWKEMPENGPILDALERLSRNNIDFPSI